MKIKNFIPALFFSLTPVAQSCCQPAKRAIPQVVQSIERDSKFQTILRDTFSTKLSDETKIIAYNKLLKQYKQPVSNYIVIDKKQCQAKVYTPDGHLIYKTEVALGRNIGDKRSGGYLVKGAQLHAYSTPGEFTIAREGSKNQKNTKLYGNRLLILAGDHTQKAYQKSQVLALHQVPSTPMGKLRANVFNNKTNKDNRVSFGCVNFLPKCFDKLRSFIKGVSTKVYILPEEKGNSLYLEKLPNGKYKFFQKKYRYESQEHKKVTVPPKSDSIKFEKPVVVPPQIQPKDSGVASDTVKIKLIPPIKIANDIPEPKSDIKLDSIKIK